MQLDAGSAHVSAVADSHDRVLPVDAPSHAVRDREGLIYDVVHEARRYLHWRLTTPEYISECDEEDGCYHCNASSGPSTFAFVRRGASRGGLAPGLDQAKSEGAIFLEFTVIKIVMRTYGKYEAPSQTTGQNRQARADATG